MSYNAVLFKCPSCEGEVLIKRTYSSGGDIITEDKVPLGLALDIYGKSGHCSSCKKYFYSYIKTDSVEMGIVFYDHTSEAV